MFQYCYVRIKSGTFVGNMFTYSTAQRLCKCMHRKAEANIFTIVPIQLCEHLRLWKPGGQRKHFWKCRTKIIAGIEREEKRCFLFIDFSLGHNYKVTSKYNHWNVYFFPTKSKDISKTTYVSNKNKKVFDFLNVIILSQQSKISLRNDLKACDAVHYVQQQGSAPRCS